MTYQTIEGVTLNAASGANTINVTTTTAAPVAVNAGNGTDTINVNETVNNGAATIGPSSGDDAVNVNPGGAGSATALFAASQRIGLTGAQTTTWNGVSVDATCVLLKDTYAGDANLDGVIDAGDYGLIDNFSPMPGASNWYNGDFNDDGVIDAADYGYIDNSFQMEGAAL